MNKKLFTLVYILTLTFSFGVYAAEDKSLLNSLLPNTKNCNYVDKKLYQPFSGINETFPGAKSVLKMVNGCIDVGGEATESLVKLLFTTAITVIIIMTVISISIAGIQYMTEEAIGKKGEAKKRLTNSFIALGLGLLSYTILYTINKQLVEFSFNPGGIDDSGAVDKGIQSASSAFAKGSDFGFDISGIEAILMTPTQPTNPYNSYTPNTPNSAPSFAATMAIGNFSTYASFGSIRCNGSFCSSSNPTVFGYLDGDGTVGMKGDNGIGNASWSTKPGCTYDNWNTTSMGVALPQGFWRAAGIPLSEVKYLGIKVSVNGTFANVLPVVDDSQSNLDFTFAAAKAYIDPTITNSNRINTSGKNVTFEIVKDYYKNYPKTNVVWIKNTSTFNNRIPCGI